MFDFLISSQIKYKASLIKDKMESITSNYCKSDLDKVVKGIKEQYEIESNESNRVVFRDANLQELNMVLEFSQENSSELTFIGNGSLLGLFVQYKSDGDKICWTSNYSNSVATSDSKKVVKILNNYHGIRDISRYIPN